MIALNCPRDVFVLSNISRAYISIANLPENVIKRKRMFRMMNGLR